ncbi:MAG: ATP-binding protein [Gemmatimonadota bacterium]
MTDSMLQDSPTAPEPRLQPIPPVPVTTEDTGLSPGLIADLIMKALYSLGARTGDELRAFVRLPFAILDEQLVDLQKRRLVEVREGGQSRVTYSFDLTSEGRNRARESMDTNGYVGPAPVPLNQYGRWVQNQSVRDVVVTEETIRQGFSHLVFDDSFLDQLGPAINSGLSLFLYGHAGNGKTTIAEAISRMLGGHVYIPWALEVEGQIIVLYDPVYHNLVTADGDEADDPLAASPLFLEGQPHDDRYAVIRRPVVFVGGELTLEFLELQYDPQTRVYQAPPHVKASGGVFIIDDFGRQLVRPRDLLNRWMVPLEKRVDYLALRNGYKFPVPFDCLVIFSTNLNPLELVDEAFLRRIRYKIMVESPNRAQYEEIFRRCCDSNAILYESTRVDHVYKAFYERLRMAPRGCHPRDIVDTVCNIAKYENTQPSLSIELLDRACRSYFLDVPGAGAVVGQYSLGDED